MLRFSKKVLERLMNFRRTRKFLFSFLFVSTFLFASQRQVVGSVTLSWDKIGDSNLIISYNGEELHPCGQWHKHAGGYTSNQAKKMQTDVLQKAKRMRGRLYRLNKIKFTFWDYIKSFFAKPRWCIRVFLMEL